MFKLFFSMRQNSGMNIFLQHIVQIFVRIELRRIGRKKEKFNLIFTLRKPFPTTGMNFCPKTEKFFSRNFQSKKLPCHCFAVTHKFEVTLPTYCGNHIDFFFFAGQFYDWSDKAKILADN